VMHLEHKAGEVLEVDFAGKTLSYVDVNSGEIITCQVFLAVFPFSGYSYVEAIPSQKQEDFIECKARALEFFGGVSTIIRPDNLKSAVEKPHRYAPKINELLTQLEVYYQCAIDPTRVAKPRDKAQVERSVNLIYQRVYAPLRNQTFYSLSSLNEAINKQNEIHLNEPFSKQSGCRRTLFEEQEKPQLKSLPREKFSIKYTASAKVARNYHITLGEDYNHYSVPYQWIGKQVTVVYTEQDVEIYYSHQRIAFHKRTRKRNAYTTVKAHMPPHHSHYQNMLAWDAEYFLQHADKIGEAVEKVIMNVLKSRPFPEQSYKACLGILRLANQFTNERLLQACQFALRGGPISYHRIHDILLRSLDKPIENTIKNNPIPNHENIRGANHYQ